MPSPTCSSSPSVVASAGVASTAASRTSGRLSSPTTASAGRVPRALEQRHRDVRAAGPDVQQCQRADMRRERVDRRRAEVHAAELAIDPAQVAQVARKRRKVVERTVEQLDGVGAAVHRCRVRRPRTMPPMIVVAGEALIDLLIDPDGGWPRSRAAGRSTRPGRSPGSAARSRSLVLSTDRFGRVLHDALEADGVDLSVTTTTDAPTTLAIAELDERGGATYRFHIAGTSAGSLRADALAAALATRPAALHVGTLGLVIEPMASVLSSGVGGADERTLVMLDPNCRPLAVADRTAYLERIDAVLARTDVVKASLDDLAYLRPGIAATDAAREMLGRGPAVAILTDGGRPVRVMTRDAVVEVPVPQVEVVDTVGAGDAFGGAFLARWISAT